MGPLSIYKFAVCFDWKFLSILIESFDQVFINKGLNLSETQCGSSINLQICSLLWLKVFINFDWKFWSSFYQFWLKVFINFDWQFDQVFIKFDWKFWLKVLIESYNLRVLIESYNLQVLIESFDWKFWLKVLIESFDWIRAPPLYTRLVFVPLLESWFCWR